MANLIRTKTFWAGLSLVVYGVVRTVNGDTEGIRDIAEGLAVIFLRNAINKQ